MIRFFKNNKNQNKYFNWKIVQNNSAFFKYNVRYIGKYIFWYLFVCVINNIYVLTLVQKNDNEYKIINMNNIIKRWSFFTRICNYNK